MAKQKVVSVNIDIAEAPDGIKEIELEKINKYLEDGYIIVDRFSTVSNSTTLYYINITFVLQKE